MSPGNAVRAAFYHDESAALNKLKHAFSGGGQRKNPIGVTMNDQCRYVDPAKVLPEVS